MVNLLFQPLAWAWFLLCGTAAYLWWKRNRGPAIAVASGVGLLSLFGGTPLSSWLLAQLERPYAGQSLSAIGPMDAVVMLGGGHNASRWDPTGIDAGNAFDRVTTTLSVLEQGQTTNLVLGGGTTRVPGREMLDGEALQHWLKARLPSGVRVHVLGHSRNTRDECVQALDLARDRGWVRIGLLTSAGHLQRAMATFQGRGFKIVPIGCDFTGLNQLDGSMRWTVLPNLDNLESAGRWAHEVVGLTYYRARGWARW